MKYDIEEIDGKFWLNVIWPDGYDCAFGPFSTKEYAEGFTQGFHSGLSSHT